eukprot:3609890-Pleurochrysis_carterae.AAC.1
MGIHIGSQFPPCAQHLALGYAYANNLTYAFSSAHVCVCKQADAPKLLCACIGSLWLRRCEDEDLALPGRQNQGAVRPCSWRL